VSELADVLAATLSRSERVLAVFDGPTRSWHRHPWPEVYARAENVAEHLLDRDVTAVGIVGETTVELVAGIIGALVSGTAVALLPGPVRGADPARWAQATLHRYAGLGVGLVLAHGAQLRLLREAGPATAVADLAELATTRRSRTLALPRGRGRFAVLQGTAGSTGTPRTAALPPEAVLANVRGLQRRIGVGPDDVGCSWLPLYHDMGLIFLLSAAVGGFETWQAPTGAFSASPFAWLSWLSTSRATMTAAPNMAYGLIGRYARRVSDVDLGRLRFALNGGEPVDCEATARFGAEMARFGFDPAALAPSYGLAESTCAVTVPRPGTGLRTDIVEVVTEDGTAPRSHAVLGEPVPGMQVRIVTDGRHRIEVPGREVGEIEIRGTSLMHGYLGEDPVDRESWFATGDLGYLTDDGLVVCGRAKELITVAGRNVFPTEVEQVAATVPGVRPGAVVAVGTGGPAARPGLVITAEFRGPDPDGARRAVVARVASECGIVPADVVFVAPGTLPRTSSGKLRRLEVKRSLEGAGR